MRKEIRSKGFKALFEEHPCLSEKISYQEYLDGKTIPTDAGEIPLEAAYADYRKVKYGQPVA